MTTQTIQSRSTPDIRPAHTSSLAKRLAGPAVGAGPLGGMFLALTMMIVMGASAMGFASAINLGMPAFVYTITPPLQMLPSLVLLRTYD